MNISTLTWFTIGACLVYAVAVDANVYPWLVLQSKRLRIEVTRRWYMVKYNPDSPWVRYRVKRNSDRLAKEILNEIKNR